MLIDTHAHLIDEKYEENRSEIIEGLQNNRMEILINPAVDLDTSRKGIQLAESWNFIFAAVGYHPHEARHASEEDLKEIEKLSTHPKVVAIGEIGLDYHYDFSPREIQQEIYEKQIDIAKRQKLPIIIHSREAHQDTFDILERNKEGLAGVLHSYSGSWEMAKRYLDLGFYLSISGPITFKNAHKLPEVAEKVPLDRILIETDSPYLTPAPYRGKVNNPAYVRYVAEEICRLRNIEFEELLLQIKENTLALFTKIEM
ncbi:TatD DNase family protein [Alkalibaculum bacchi]|uniref:TatD DNase family protein n=1 Tax=Alkalibaculum bacchi TaxID=645887 RepID=A0A366I573_9FIRM|nr:TatD family hydrolase [Alkalibaculum bacchi]RBP62065.1 TatD DNase family protein [Alkalibaculum bacchi]